MRFVSSFLAIFIVGSQLGSFFLAGFLFHRTSGWLIGFFISLIITLVCRTHANLVLTLKNVQDLLLTFFETPGTFALEEVDILPFVPAKALEKVNYRKVFSMQYFRKLANLDASYQPIRAFVVKTFRPPFPTDLKAYANTEGTSMVFLRDRPENLSVFEMFKLYHELGHLTLMGTMLDVEKYAVVARRTFTIVAVIPTLYFFPWVWPILCVYLAQQVYRERITINRGVEVFADSFAFEAIQERGQLPQLFGFLEEYYEEEISSLSSSASKSDKKSLHMFYWRRMLLNQGKRRLAKNKLQAPGITFIGPDDVVMSLLFAYLAQYAVLPGFWYFAVFGGLAILVLLFDFRGWSYLPYFHGRLDTVLASPAGEERSE